MRLSHLVCAGFNDRVADPRRDNRPDQATRPRNALGLEIRGIGWDVGFVRNILVTGAGMDTSGAHSNESFERPDRALAARGESRVPAAI